MAANHDKNIEKLLKQQDHALKYKHLKNFVLFLGETGKGKSTLTEFLSGKQLRAEGSNGLYVIESGNDRIGNAAKTILSQTNLPAPVWHRGLPVDTHYLDCPGFEDTRNSIMDVLCTTYTVAALRFCRSAKLVLVTSYDDVRVGGNRNGFMKLVKILSKFSSNLDKFHKSIALFVTKVPNLPVVENGKMVYVSDDNMRGHVVAFLQSIKTTISTEEDVAHEKIDVYKNAIKLIDMILPENVETMQTPRIGIFRCPDEQGLIQMMPRFKETRNKLHEIIQNTLQFVEVEASDFSYTISPESKLYLQELVQNMVQSIGLLLENVFEQIEYCYEKHEKDSINVETLKKEFSEQNAIWRDTINAIYNLEFTCDVFKHFAKHIERLLSTHILINLKMQFAEQIETLTGAARTVEIFEKVSNAKYRISTSHWLALFNRTKSRIQNTELWYASLIDIFQVFATYEWQRGRDSVVEAAFLDKLLKWSSIAPGKGETISGRDIKDAVFEVCKERIACCNDVGASPTQLKHLLNLSKFAFEGPDMTTDGDRCRFAGPFLMLNDIIPALGGSVKQLEIFATYKVFIDCDLVHIGEELQVLIIAPVWEVVGETRSIRLDGAEGQPFKEAASYNPELIEAANGYPGYPGGIGGSLVGIGQEIVNGENLRISTNGGKGGRGQDGGQGIDGEDGIDAGTPEGQLKWFWEDPFEFNYSQAIDPPEIQWRFDYLFPRMHNIQKYVASGTDGKRGTKGGNGGRSGVGGLPGHVLFLGMYEGNLPEALTAIGDGGEKGKGGSGGAGGAHGMDVSFIATRNEPIFDIFLWLKFLTISNVARIDRGNAPDGPAGIDGGANNFPSFRTFYNNYADIIHAIKDYRSVVFERSKFLVWERYRTSLDKILSTSLLFENWNDLKFLTHKFLRIEKNVSSMGNEKIDFKTYYALLQHFIILFVCRNNQLDDTEANIACFIFLVSLVRKQTKFGNVQHIESNVQQLSESVCLYLSMFVDGDSEIPEIYARILDGYLDRLLSNTASIDGLLEKLSSVGVSCGQLDREYSLMEIDNYSLILKIRIAPDRKDLAEGKSSDFPNRVITNVKAMTSFPAKSLQLLFKVPTLAQQINNFLFSQK